MNVRRMFIATGVALAAAAWAVTGNAVDDSGLGLSKTSVFDDPTPMAPVYDAPPPGAPVTAPARYFPGAPPVIPHSIAGLAPITGHSNACLGCHDKPDLIGKKTEGVPTAMTTSHYSDPWTKDKPDRTVSGAHYNCNLCHAPQSDAKPLVKNTLD